MLSIIHNKILENQNFLDKYNVLYDNFQNIKRTSKSREVAVDISERIIIRRKEPSSEQITEYNPDLIILNIPVKHLFVIECDDMCFYKNVYVRVADESSLKTEPYFLPEYYCSTLVFGEPDTSAITSFIINTEKSLFFEKANLRDAPPSKKYCRIKINPSKMQRIEFTEIEKKPIQTQIYWFYKDMMRKPCPKDFIVRQEYYEAVSLLHSPFYRHYRNFT